MNLKHAEWRQNYINNKVGPPSKKWKKSYERNPLSQRLQKLSWRAINIYVPFFMSSLNVYCIFLPTYNEPISLQNIWKKILPKKFFWKTVTLMICSDLNVSLTRRDVHLKTDKDRNSSTQLHDSHNGGKLFSEVEFSYGFLFWFHKIFLRHSG